MEIDEIIDELVRRLKGLPEPATNGWKIGDRIMIRPDSLASHIAGKLGTIKKIECHQYSIQFDEPHSMLHDCGSEVQPRHGWFCLEEELKRAPDGQ